MLFLLSCAFQWACATVVHGTIPPSAFEFVSVVPISTKKPGGWKVAKVKILLGRISSVISSTAHCDIEVGVPQVNLRGPISDEFAQMQTAAAADAAARLVLIEELPTSELCRGFQLEMNRILSSTIPGVRVTKFLTLDVPYKTFP